VILLLALTNKHFSEIQDGGSRHLEKYTKMCISANSLSIYTKFGMLIGTVDTSVIRGSKCHFSENQEGGGRHSGKYTNGIYRPICDQYAPNFVRW